LIGACFFAFAQIFQLKEYQQYGMHGNIIMFQQILIWYKLYYLDCTYDDNSIVMFLKRKLEYKSIKMSSFVCPNIVIKALQELCQIPLY